MSYHVFLNVNRTCFRPSYTAIVKPTNDGKIVERRDQVLITFSFRHLVVLRPFSSNDHRRKVLFFKLRPMVNLLSKCTTHGQKNYLVRRRTISLSDLAFLLRVLYPIAG